MQREPFLNLIGGTLASNSLYMAAANVDANTFIGENIPPLDYALEAIWH